MLGSKKSGKFVKLGRERIKGREEASALYAEEINSLKSEIQNRATTDTGEFFISIKRNVANAAKREQELANKYSENLHRKEIQFNKELSEADESTKSLLKSLKKSLQLKENEYNQKLERLDFMIAENVKIQDNCRELLSAFKMKVNVRDMRITHILKQIHAIMSEDESMLKGFEKEYAHILDSTAKVKQLTIN